MTTTIFFVMATVVVGFPSRTTLVPTCRTIEVLISYLCFLRPRLSLRYVSSKPYVTFMDFRKILFHELIVNGVNKMKQDRLSKKGAKPNSKIQHYLVSASTFCKCMNGKWFFFEKTKYQKYCCIIYNPTNCSCNSCR